RAREERGPKANASHRSASFRRQRDCRNWGTSTLDWIHFPVKWIQIAGKSAKVGAVMRMLDASPGVADRRLGLLRIDRELVAIGILGGLLSGLLGVGGGIVMVPLLVLWARYSQRDAHAASLAAIIPISVAGILTYGIAGEVKLGPA